MSRPLQQVEWRGEQRALLDLAHEHNLPPSTLRTRLKLGWTLEAAVLTPIGVTAGGPRRKGPPKPKPSRPQRRAALAQRKVRDVERQLDEAVRREHLMPWERDNSPSAWGQVARALDARRGTG